MIRTALRGLRGRLLLSFVATSAVTLVVAAAITIGPLQSRLRDESETALQQTTEDDALGLRDRDGQDGQAQADHRRSRRRRLRRGRDRPASAPRHRASASSRASCASGPTARACSPPTSASATPAASRRPSSTTPTSPRAPDESALRLAIQAITRERVGDPDHRRRADVRDAALRQGDKVVGVVVTQRNLTEVATTVRLVRNALFTAAAISLAVAIALGLGALRHADPAPQAPAARGAAHHRRRARRRPRRSTAAATRSATSPARWAACRRSCAGRRRRGARSSPPPRTSCARR